MSIKPNKIAILLWLYHTHLWQEFKDLLLPLREDIHLYLGLCETQEEKENISIAKEAEDQFDLCTINYFDNAGVDVRPFLYQICSIDPIAEPFFFKLHSKMSLWGANKTDWRAMLLHSLIGSRNIFKDNIILLKSEQCGMVCNKNLILSNRENNHKGKIKEVCGIIGIEYDQLKNKKFCAGNMFAGNTKLYQDYLQVDYLELNNKLILEKGKIPERHPTGTYAHALERVFGYIVEDADKEIIGTEMREKFILINQEAPNGQLNLVINYNNSCYLEEDPNINGLVIDNNKNELWIRWTDKSNIIERHYVCIGSNKYLKLEKSIPV